MKKIILSLFLIFFSVYPSWAGDTPSAPQEAVEMGEMVDVQVNGLVCDFCARAIEKTFGQHDEVLRTDVNLDSKIITIHMKKDRNLDDETIAKLITDAGYEVISVKRRGKGEK